MERAEMRLRLLLALLVFLFLVVVTGVFIGTRTGTALRTKDSPNPLSSLERTDSANTGGTSLAPPAQKKIATGVSESEDSPPEQHQAYVESRCAELLELGMNDDAGSFSAIMGELQNRDPAIRKAALEAAIQFGSRDAIPWLVEAASQTENGSEKADLMKAVEFLKLPSLSETIAQNGPGHKPSAKSNPASRSKSW